MTDRLHRRIVGAFVYMLAAALLSVAVAGCYFESRVAQLVERRADGAMYAGSIPAPATT